MVDVLNLTNLPFKFSSGAFLIGSTFRTAAEEKEAQITRRDGFPGKKRDFKII